MRVRVTEKVDYHHTNNGYKCILVEFLKTDNNIRRRNNEVQFDWLPLDEEIMKINRVLYDLSPTFRAKLDTLVNNWM
jgi:hypothetical protein